MTDVMLPFSTVYFSHSHSSPESTLFLSLFFLLRSCLLCFPRVMVPSDSVCLSGSSFAFLCARLSVYYIVILASIFFLLVGKQKSAGIIPVGFTKIRYDLSPKMHRRTEKSPNSAPTNAGESNGAPFPHDREQKSAASPTTTVISRSKKRKTTDCMGRTCVEPAHQPPPRDNLATVVFPGFLASFAQACKYTGPDEVIMLDKKDKTRVVARARCRYSPRVLHNVLPAADIRENELGWSFNPIGLFSCLKNAGTRWFFRIEGMPMMHTVAALNNMGGYEDQKDCLLRIEDAIRLLDEEMGADEDEEKKENNNGEDDNVVEETAQPQSSTKKKRKKKHKKKIVLFGFSRGAATVMHTSLKLPHHLASRISLVVAEAPFDTFEGVMADSSWFPSLNRCAFKAIGNPSDPSAYSFPESTHLACPIAFITSNGDTRVPPKTTQRCIDAVKSLYPHIKVEHLSLSSARHPTMTYSNAADIEAYVSFMERLYDTYLPMESLSH